MSPLGRFLAVGVCAVLLCAVASAQGPVPGPNVNMVSGRTWPGGDPNLQKQNEPSIAVSTRNPLHLLAGANDYRTVDFAGLPFVLEDDVTPDAWLGLFKSFDGGATWKSTLLPGCPWNTAVLADNPCIGTPLSPLRGKGYNAAADPTVRAGAAGRFHYSGIAFNRDDRKKGALFVATYMDDNNREAGDTIRYVGTSIIDENAGGQFTDKPWLAIDKPRLSATCAMLGGIPGGNVYVAYTIFLGNNPDNIRSKLYVATSKDCGQTWTKTKVSETNAINQGAALSIDPDSGAVYAAWRRFKNVGGTGQVLETDAILVAKSTDFGQTFAKGFEVVPSIVPFDQRTSQSQLAFRTNAYPTMAVANGRVYVAWAERVGPVSSTSEKDSRIVLYSSNTTDGVSWTPHIPNPVDDIVGGTSNGRGHQLMPALAFAAGKLMLIYYDLREDHTYGRLNYPLPGNMGPEERIPTGDLPSNPNKVFTPFVTDKTTPALLRRHTINVMVKQILPTPANAVRVSRYLFGETLAGGHEIRQLQFNPPNLPMFRKGTVPFLGDYIDIGGLAFVLNPNNLWDFNTTGSAADVFHATWTDNRNVRPANSPDKYAPPNPPPGKPLPPSFDPNYPRPACVDGTGKVPGMMNQDVYTARVDQGLVVGALGNTKGLNSSLKRAFSIFVRNTLGACKTYQLTISSSDASASFKAAEILNTLVVSIGPKSSISRYVYATSSVLKAKITLNVTEIGSLGCPVVGTLLAGKVLLNPDTLNPEIENPEIENPVPGANILMNEVYNPEIENPEIENPEIENPEIENPEIENPEIENPEIENREVANPEIENPEIENPEIENPEIENPEIENPEIENMTPQGTTGRVTDVSWTVRNKGNTTATYNARLLAGQDVPLGIQKQLVVHRLYRTPVAQGCTLKYQTQSAVLVNVPSPSWTNLDNIASPEIENGGLKNATFTLAPGDRAKITLRLFDPLPAVGPRICGAPEVPCAAGDYNPETAITAVVASQAANANPPAGTPPPITAFGGPLTVLTTSLSAGALTTPYSDFLLSTGGTPPRTWSITSGSLPGGLSLTPATGQISGTPTAAGVFNFTVQVSAGAQTATRGLSITVIGSLSPGVNLVFTTQPSAVAPGQIITPPVRVQALTSGAAPIVGLAITLSIGANPGLGTLSGTTTVMTNLTGHAIFADLSINNAGNGYTLVANAAGAAAVTSSAFVVAPPLPVFGATPGMANARVNHSATLLPTGKVVVFGGQDASGTPMLNLEAYNPVANTFSAFGNGTGTPVAGHSAVWLPQGVLLISGGRTGGGIVSAQQYMDVNGSVWAAPAMLAARCCGHTATVLPDGRVLLVGGSPGAGAEVFTPPAGPSAAIGGLASRTYHTATLLPNGLVLIAGGNIWGSGPTNTAWLFNPVTNTFTATAGNMTAAREEHMAALLPNGDVLLAGGSGPPGLSSAEVYHTATGTFTATGSMMAVRYHGTATLLASGKVLLAGGHLPPAWTATSELYDYTTGAFTPGPSMAARRAWQTDTLLPSGAVLMAGGGGDPLPGFPLASAEVYYPADPPFATAAFNPTGSMATPRQGATVTRLPNGKILVTGGKHHNLGTYPNAVNTAEVYDPATGAWSATANNMNFRRRWHTATLLPRTGGVLICGGYHGDGPPSEDNTCQIYDPSTNSFTSVMTMSSSRASHTATLLHDGRVLIAGGFTGATILNTAEIFDPSTGTITLLPATMTAPRLNHTATLLGNAMVLIAGGTNSGGQLASAEFFNYSTNTFGVVASMNVARERHTATPLPTGDILLAGGYNSTNLSLSSAEVYSMASGSFIPKTMTTSRDRHTATLLPTGKVLLAGTDTVGCEVYDAFAGTFSSTAAIDTVRSDAMAVLLPNGRVLVAGGQNGGAVLSSAVLYNPGP